jgi:hypothetical protein
LAGCDPPLVILSAAKDLGREREKPLLRWPDSFGRLRTGSSAAPQDDKVSPEARLARRLFR